MITCTPGERHCIGGQMLAGLLQGGDWEVFFLGRLAADGGARRARRPRASGGRRTLDDDGRVPPRSANGSPRCAAATYRRWSSRAARPTRARRRPNESAPTSGRPTPRPRPRCSRRGSRRPSSALSGNSKPMPTIGHMSPEAVRILVVDDEPNITDARRDGAALQGSRWDGGHRPRRRSPRSRTFRPDLVVLDVMLPDLDGFEVVPAPARRRRIESRCCSSPPGTPPRTRCAA